MVCFSDMEEEDIIIITHRFIRDFEKGCEEEAAHYAKHPAIVGWQIDNEINCEENGFIQRQILLVSRGISEENSMELWRNLWNEAWGTTFWN